MHSLHNAGASAGGNAGGGGGGGGANGGGSGMSYAAIKDGFNKLASLLQQFPRIQVGVKVWRSWPECKCKSGTLGVVVAGCFVKRQMFCAYQRVWVG
jgi:hypothetical protein